MHPDWQIPRHGLAWLLISYVVVLVPHLGHLPFWTTAIAVAALLWRLQIYRGVWRYPQYREKVMLLVFFAAGLLLHYRSLTGLDPMVALLICTYTLKLLEMQRKRDLYVLIWLSYFIDAIVCLYFQSIAVTLYVVAALIPITAALIALHQANGMPFGAPLKQASLLLAQSLPLMLVLFLIMPRLGALWAVPQQNRAVTGISHTMSPGDFSDLSRSADTAFRVEFFGPIPPPRQRYWRGLVLSQFDGRTWRQDPWQPMQLYGEPASSWDRLIERNGPPLHYQVTLEPTNAPWLFVLSTPKPATAQTGLTRDFNLRSIRKVTSKMQYAVTSWLDYRLSPESLDDEIRRSALQLPPGYNPQTRSIAQQWRRESATEQALIDRVLALFNQFFVYTLQPPPLGEHSVDEFLWQTQRGFCEHFAGAFVFFMRAAGIPARVVAGYQGGEVHPQEGYLTVRQYDAHAWAEVWLAGEGWRRVDPTFAVAPQRIESGLFDALSETEGFLSDSPLALVRYRNISWLNQLRLRLEALDYTWAKWVLGYERVQQDALLSLLGKVDPLRIGLFLLAGGFLGLLPWLLRTVIGRPDRQRHELDRLYMAFCRQCAKNGLPRQIGEGPASYGARAVDAFPEAAEQVALISRYYEEGRYQGDDQAKQKIKALFKNLRLRPLPQ